MSSLKKNTLAAALVAGMGLAGAAVAYDYGTLKDPANCGYIDCSQPGGSPASEQTPSVDLRAPEPVAWQMIPVLGSTAYRYTMREHLVWDINPQDNAVNFTQGFTARLQLEDGALFDTTYTPTVFNIDPANCSLQDHDANAATPNILLPNAGAGRTTQDIYLDPSLACTWDVNFDNYYASGSILSIRVTPKQGVTNPQNPSQGIAIRYDNARLASLDEFVNGPMGNIVHGTFWLINPSNDAEFVGSRQRRDILVKVDAAAACTDIRGADVNKFIDVADNWTEDQLPKTRFSWDGRLGSAEDATVEGASPALTMDQSQWIDLGDITLTTNNAAGGGFQFQAGDRFTTVLQGDAEGWLAFENGDNATYNDDLWLVNGSCGTGTAITNGRGRIEGSRVVFNYNVADIPGLALNSDAASANLTVCGYVDTDTVINDQEIDVATTLFRANMLGGSVTFGGNRQCKLLPLRYNGSTMEAFMLNPGSNTNQQTFLRITNRSKTDGWVRLEGIDDAGAAAPGGQVSVWVPAGASVQIDSGELENGSDKSSGAWGDGTGRWRTVATAEFPGMVIQSYVRTTTNQFLSNITDSDTRGEQYNRDWAEGTFASEVGERPADFRQEFTPDFRGNNSSTSIPGGPNNGANPSGGTTDECNNPGVSTLPGIAPVPGCDTPQP